MIKLVRVCLEGDGREVEGKVAGTENISAAFNSPLLSFCPISLHLNIGFFGFLFESFF